MKVKTTFASVALGLLIAGGASAQTIGYVNKSATNAAWTMINAGAAAAAEDLGVEMIAVGPSTPSDLSNQLEIFENLVSQGVDAIGIAPADSAGVAPAIEEAMALGIPIIAIDTGVTGTDVVSFIATDNVAVAKVQGSVAATLVENGDTIIYVTGNQAQSTGRNRRDGFMAAFGAARPDSEVLEVPTEWNSEQALEGVEALLNARDDVKMVVSAWDGGTMGAKAALENLGYSAGDVLLVGFDGATDAIAAMDEGWVQADTAQMLFQIGYQGIATTVAAARGETVPARIDTGFFLVTPSTSAVYKAMVGIE